VDEGPRASDAERERCVAALQRHFADGRLTGDEFTERVERALQARMLRELYEVTADLPELPVVEVPHRPLGSALRRRRWRRG
jgi:hypothetical protein